MLANWLYKKTETLPCRLISRDGAPYLERYYVGQRFGVTVYLHRFVGCDGDPELHDHPWNALSIVLSGSYIELRGRLDGDVGIAKRRVMVKFWNWISADSMHRITSCEPETWTLFMHRPRVKGWGFFVEQFPGLKVCYKPFDTRPFASWWDVAPIGRDAGREPLMKLHWSSR